MNTPPRLATRADLDEAADALTVAFADYPWTRYIIPEDDYAGRLRELQTLYLQYAHAHGLVAVTDDRAGVIALLPPDAPEPDPAMIERITRLYGDRIDRLDTGESPADAWRVETLGVRPDRQGRGLASALLEFALNDLANRGGGQVTLDTSSRRNVRLYARHGFCITAHMEGPGRPPVWTMTRVLGGLSPHETRAHQAVPRADEGRRAREGLNGIRCGRAGVESGSRWCCVRDGSAAGVDGVGRRDATHRRICSVVAPS